MELPKEDVIINMLLKVCDNDKELFFKLVEKLRRRYKSHGDISRVDKIGRKAYTQEELVKAKLESKLKAREKRTLKQLLSSD